MRIFWLSFAAAIAAFFAWQWWQKSPRSTTGSFASALFPTPVQAHLGQGSGSLQSNEAISYGTVPLAYSKSTIPNATNVGKPIHQHSHFVVPTIQRNHPIRIARPRTGGR